MDCFKYTPHTNYDIRYDVSQGVSMCPKTVSSRCPESIITSRCPESVSRCSHLFQARIVTATSSSSQLHAGFSYTYILCSIQILILARSTLSSGPNMVSQVGTARFSEGPLLRRSVVPKVQCSEGPLFRRYIAPKVRYSEIKVHWSENKVQYSEKE